MREACSSLENRLQTERDETKKRNMALWQILLGSHTEYPEGDDQLLIATLLDKDKERQDLMTNFNEVSREISAKSEEVQRLQVQVQHYKYVIAWSILLMLLVGIFLQYIHLSNDFC